MVTAIANAKTKRAWQTNVGLKVVMAVTGLFFVFFILLHMYGNLKMFSGPEAYNGYAEGLRTFLMPILPYQGLLWILRVVLTVSIVAHVYCAFTLWHKAGKARGSKYAVDRRKTQTYSARTMRMGGVIIIVFILFHLAQYTLLWAQVGGNYHELSPYHRMIAGFGPKSWFMVVFYAIAIALISMHVRHGVFSALATLGLSTRKREVGFNLVAYFCAAALFVGFMAPPVAICLGFIH